jgi:hypothetical protein
VEKLPTVENIAYAIHVIRGERVDRAGVRAHMPAALAAHDAAILKLLAEIRRLTQFPEPTRREIGFTANWRDLPPSSDPKKSRYAENNARFLIERAYRER